MGSLSLGGARDVGDNLDGLNFGEVLGTGVGLADPKRPAGVRGGPAGGNPAGVPLGSMGPEAHQRESAAQK